MRASETPVTDGFEQALDALRRAPYGVGDEALWEVEGSVLWEARMHLEAWERVVRGLEAGRATGRGELGCRDGVAGLVRRLPGPVAEVYGEALGEVDGRYMELSVEDDDAPGGGAGWWWGRRPRAGWA
ncbi:hypothetical protein ACFWVC_16370 [Streptomyces sp. NPDC058691]|uniref:hypothetical protein n=1 Tax=Streptomyces sp. NPDC058691 TaxID=3346601 RepID=UPI003657B00F